MPHDGPLPDEPPHGAPTNLTDLLARWRVPAPDAVRPAGPGTNNSVHVVEAGGRRYVVRGYQNQSADRVAAEHRLLTGLADVGLSFAVPRPLPTRDGATFVPTPSGPVALFGYLPGRPAGRTTRDLALAGEVLAYLDLALAELPAGLAPADWRHPLSEVHPAVPDLGELAAELARVLPGEQGDDPGWLHAAAERVDAMRVRWWETLPVQVVHNDFALGNLLVHDDGRPSAVLDFEFAGLDLRVADLVGAVSMATAEWQPSDRATDVLCRAYLSRLPLSTAERAAFPDLLRLRALESLVWRAGRWRQGQARLDEVRDRLAGARQLDRWLEQHGPTLVDDLTAL
ncbi:phosphotransferase enzyme family protein [Actinopolymorpha singaporensis]|uniref:Phosphotransferase enzyme family protein n=1 Tax=Actinopolymorpha singaporensis TaxID=117157 RepID=A0A1H1YWQ2_9ACTN|nr:phosphotransferase [Actinopolymorpha singaporensis]SDT25828.1 Phosphotransferase enzyme family protein [Actinopolymorpha singaporensis]